MQTRKNERVTTLCGASRRAAFFGARRSSVLPVLEIRRADVQGPAIDFFIALFEDYVVRCARQSEIVNSDHGLY